MVGDWFVVEGGRYEVVDVGVDVIVQVRNLNAGVVLVINTSIPRIAYANRYTAGATIHPGAWRCFPYTDNLCLTPDDTPVVDGVCA